MNHIAKSLLCYSSLAVSGEIQEHYSKFMKDFVAYEHTDYVITATIDVNIVKYLVTFQMLYCQVRHFCKPTMSGIENSVKIFNKRGYPIVCLHTANPISENEFPAFMESLYGRKKSMIGATYHVLTYVRVPKIQSPTNQSVYIAIETTSEDGLQFYIAMTQEDLFKMLKRRYLYDAVEVLEFPVEEEELLRISTQNLTEKMKTD